MAQGNEDRFRIAIWGATGGAGAEVLRQALADPRVGEVVAFTRRPLSIEHDRLQVVQVEDFSDVADLREHLSDVDVAYWCLGVSQSVVPQEDRYREITYEYTLAAARVLKDESPKVAFHFLSGSGADPSGKSWMMWARVKGETEVALGKVGLREVVVWRPSYIHVVAGREKMATAERVAALLYPVLRVFPGLSNSSVDLAHAMLHEATAANGSATYNASTINKLAREYRGERPRRRWWRPVGYLALAGLVFAFVMFATAWTSFGAAPEGERLRRMQASPQYVDSGFDNPLPAQQADMLTILSRWLGSGEHTQPAEPIAILDRSGSEFDEPPPSGLRITWLGHSSMLIEIDGHRVLTDPVFSERSSPWSFYGPKRFHPVPLANDDLPPLDAVVLSHDHYDHLDKDTIIALSEQVPLFVAPLGVGAHLEYWGVEPERIVELDWWDSTQVGGLELTATPSRHFSGRSLWDQKRTLWASWAIIGEAHRVYFSGDTAMFPGFKEIGERFGPFDATMMEVGAYSSDWPDVHLGPEQAVDAHRMVRGQLLFPVHWGTFDLAYHTWVEPVERLRIAAAAADVPLVVPQPGQSIEPSAPPPLKKWWADVPWQTAEESPAISTGLEGSRG